MNRLFVVDFENDSRLDFIKNYNLDYNDKVVIFYSRNKENIHIKYVEDLFYIGCDIEFIKAEVGYPNALDFQLITYVSYIASTIDITTRLSIYIISKDKGFGLASNYLKTLIDVNCDIHCINIDDFYTADYLRDMLTGAGLSANDINSGGLQQIHSKLVSTYGQTIGTELYYRVKKTI